MNSCAPENWVLNWQTKLHEWAWNDKRLKFHDLYNLVYDLRTLSLAWQEIRSNRGSKTAGVDGVTRYHVESRVGTQEFLEQIHLELKTQTYRPSNVRQKGIPKKNGKMRYLGIPTLKDRVVQQALRMVMEPIFEADFYESSYAYRPGRRTQDAIAEIHHFTKPHAGYSWIIEGDIKGCFDHVDHEILIREIRKRIKDNKIIRLCRRFLKTGVVTELGAVKPTITGTPQGGIISPLFANIYLTILDRHFDEIWKRMYPSRQYWRSKGYATYRMVRFADDFVVMVKGTKEHAEEIKQQTAEFISQELKMELSLEKTMVTHISEGFAFLGHRIQLMPDRSGKPVVYTLPTKESLMRVKEKIKRITSRGTIPMNLKHILGQINPILRGWSNYYRYDAAKHTLAYLDAYTWRRVYRWMRKKYAKMPVKKLKRTKFPDWCFREGGTELFRPAKVKVERYRFRGSNIPNRWNQRIMESRTKNRYIFPYNENRMLESLSDYLSF